MKILLWKCMIDSYNCQMAAASDPIGGMLCVRINYNPAVIYFIMHGRRDTSTFEEAQGKRVKRKHRGKMLNPSSCLDNSIHYN